MHPHRVLSIQSHVVHGFVGNKAATFPLQVLGIDVDAINTVTLSNRPDYDTSCRGFKLEANQFRSLIEGLQSSHLLQYSALISGYVNTTEALDTLESTVRAVKAASPHSLYICDPVLGDHGKFYVPTELLLEYKTKLLPLADVITPNYFEAQELSGVNINSLSSAVEACRRLHAIGPHICFLKGLSLSTSKNNNPLSMMLSKWNPVKRSMKIYRIDSNRLEGKFAGCGDLVTSLVAASLVKRSEDIDYGQVLDFVASKMSQIIQLTHDAHSRELRVIDGIDIYRAPTNLPLQHKSCMAHGPVVGVIFDMDGTLTMPGAIDFKSLYSRLGMGDNYDIITTLNAMEDEVKKSSCWSIVNDEEEKAERRMQLQPGLKDCLLKLSSCRVRMAIATRNNLSGVKAFIKRAELPEAFFSIVVSRNCLDGINKPDPEVARYVLNQWDARSNEVWFVGDSIDDMKCGRGAGCKTCLIINTSNRYLVVQYPHLIDVAVNTLTEFLAQLDLD